MGGAIAPVAENGPPLGKSLKMLVALDLTNFQAHANTRVQFGPGVTAIVGPTDVGKSAIIRALRWLCLNQGKADAFIRHGTKEVTVRLVVDDGQTITRSRGPGGNTYSLEDAEYRAFGTTVPQPIERLLNVGEINFQAQHDGPFWLGETAGEVSRQLNAVVDLGVIDEVLARANSSLFAARTIAERANTSLEAAKQAKDDLAWVKEATAAWVEVEQYGERERAAKVDRAVCEAFIDDYKYLNADYRNKLEVAKALLAVAVAGRAAASALSAVALLADAVLSARGWRDAVADKRGAAAGLAAVTRLGDSHAATVADKLRLVEALVVARPLARIAAARTTAAPALLAVAVAGRDAAKLKAQAGMLAGLLASAKGAANVPTVPPAELTRLESLLAAYTTAKNSRAGLEQYMSLATRVHREAKRAASFAAEAAQTLEEKTAGLCPICGGPLDGKTSP